MTMDKPLTRVTDEQEDAIDSLRISLHSDFDRFNECVLNMMGALCGEGLVAGLHGADKYREALKHLGSIEDAIKRFREGRKQEFDEG